MFALFRRLLTPSKNHRIQPRQRRVFRPVVEVLEDRRLLSVGAEFHVNQTTLGNQADSDNASDRLGRTAIVWAERRLTTEDSDILLRVFDHSGIPGIVDTTPPAPLTNEIVVDNSFLNDFQPAVSMSRQSGTLVVVWTRLNQAGDLDVLGRHFNVNGAPLSNTFVIAGTVGVNEFEPDVAVSPATGEFVVSYTRVIGSSVDVLARRFAPLGTIPQRTIQVAVTSLVEQHSSIAYSQSTFVQFNIFAVGFQENVGNPSNIRLKRYNGDGTLLSSRFMAASNLREENPSVAGDPTGGFLVAWQRFDLTGIAGWNIFARRVSNLGLLGATFTVARTTAAEINAAAGVDPTTGNFAVGYQSISGNFTSQTFSPATLRIRVTEFFANNTRRATVDMNFQVFIGFNPSDPNLILVNGFGTAMPSNILGPAISFGAGVYTVSYTKLNDPSDQLFGIFARRGRVV
jgi:hypothetical protein